MAQLNVDLVSADRKIWSGEAQMVSAPAADGEIGILADHSPLLSVLREGSVRIKATQGTPLEVRISGGFLSVDANQVTIVADSVESESAR
ncbi:F0F1 ATP synthase subunit epsilon [Cellulosimicrobium marinum]|uniref:F0F1 ATP synthase subunit epsilon n=1 Tax=Cellulosimicrobium marinum TaxID=1638992 RepID=UPI001E3ED129|nr:F0F1 ATP synthase subunit epsilon [Cellulosimicrobium marinum]MCB7138054.1 F0F1 ATP synthase subunit epsilon [Cellulosimicrobium marinum]